MTGICDNGHLIHWRNTRGSRKPERCFTEGCGTAVHQAAYNSETRQYERQQVGSRGGKLMQCSVCPRKCRVTSQNSNRILETPARFRVWVSGEGHQIRTVEAGQVVCWRHCEFTESECGTGM